MSDTPNYQHLYHKYRYKYLKLQGGASDGNNPPVQPEQTWKAKSQTPRDRIVASRHWRDGETTINELYVVEDRGDSALVYGRGYYQDYWLREPIVLKKSDIRSFTYTGTRNRDIPREIRRVNDCGGRDEPIVEPGQTWKKISHGSGGIHVGGPQRDPETIKELYVLEDRDGSALVYGKYSYDKWKREPIVLTKRSICTFTCTSNRRRDIPREIRRDDCGGRDEPIVEPGQTWKKISHGSGGIHVGGPQRDPETIKELYVLEDRDGSALVYGKYSYDKWKREPIVLTKRSICTFTCTSNRRRDIPREIRQAEQQREIHQAPPAPPAPPAISAPPAPSVPQSTSVPAQTTPSTDNSDSSLSEAEYQSRREQDNQCVVCMENPREVAFIPCGHIICCQACGETIRAGSNKCPMCRGSLQGVLRVYT